jgi:hypothetical protein
MMSCEVQQAVAVQGKAERIPDSEGSEWEERLIPAPGQGEVIGGAYEARARDHRHPASRADA